MRQILLSCACLFAGAVWAASPASAQPEQEEAEASPAPAGERPAAEGEPQPAVAEAEPEEPEAEEEEEEPPPSLAPPELPPLSAAVEVEEEPELPDPAQAAAAMQEAEPEAEEPDTGWTAPETVFAMHGYLRLRGSLDKRLWLGRSHQFDRLPLEGRSNVDPFLAFRPTANYPPLGLDDEGDPAFGAADAAEPVLGGCDGDTPSAETADGVTTTRELGACGRQRTVSANLRLRLKPELHISDDVRVKSWIDVLDNYAFGSNGAEPFELTSAVKVRRVWGEVRNRDLGELRFGRMGADWGLGILDNGGDRKGIDSDFSSEVDRVMAVGNLAGFYLMAAWDWNAEGSFLPGSESPSGIPIDRAQEDDTDQFTFAVARRKSDDEQASALARGELVFNAGLFFRYTDQLLTQPTALDDTEASFARIDQQLFIPDVWMQLLYEGLRLEIEGTWVEGRRDMGCPRLTRDVGDGRTDADEQGPASTTFGQDGACQIRQIGVAMELEYRLLDDRLGLHLDAGFATGDGQAYGLAATNDPQYQDARSDSESGDIDVANGDITTFAFHPDYRIDLILWRTIMRRVAGAYYFRPGISYDFIRDPYGELLGGRVDVIYSRASVAEQTWGLDANLGLELNASLYYRSEDGPDPIDGFYGLVQWGILFPFSGLGHTPEDRAAGANSVDSAMIFRGVAGIAF